MPDSLEPRAVAPLLRGRFGRPYLFRPTCRSTQELLRGAGLPEGAVAAADHQTAGRGREGRAWHDVAGRSLLLSVLLRPPTGSPPLPQLSLVAAIAVADAVAGAIEGLATAGETAKRRLETAVKWPNDVLVAGKKAAGILLEATSDEVVCGIGVNVNQTPSELPQETRAAPTSLRAATGRTHLRAALLADLLARLEDRYETWLREGLAPLLPALERQDALRGRRLRAGDVYGTGAGIAPDGRLLVRTPSGQVAAVESGEVTLEP